MILNLVFPEVKHQRDCEDFIKEVINKGEDFNGTSSVESFPYLEWLQKVINDFEGKELVNGRVPATTFLAYYEDVLVGFINIRHELNSLLLECGGHIGYMIRPSQRNKGYAKIMLKLGLNYCKKTLKLKKVLITCDPENEPSKRTILSANAQYENTLENTELGTVNRYWVTL